MKRENNNDTQLDAAVVDAENRCKAEMVQRLRYLVAKYPDLLGMPAQYPPLKGKGWAGGKYNTPERLAGQAVAEAYQLANAMDTLFYASVRAIAEFSSTPYNVLLEIYRENTILDNTGERDQNRKYIPYKLWQKTTTKGE